MSLGGGKEPALADLAKQVELWREIAETRGVLLRDTSIRAQAYLEAYAAVDIVLTSIEAPREFETGAPLVDKILELLRRLNEAEVLVAELEKERRAVRDGAKPGARGQ